MQVARLIEPRAERTLAAKLRQIARAQEIERAVGKAGVLDRYVTLAPFGGNLEGVRAASLAYFGKEPLKLTIAEAALLVALPQSPEARRPDRFPAAARAARDRVLDRVVARGVISADEARAREGRAGPRGAKALPRARRRMRRKRRSPPTRRRRSSGSRSTRGCRRSSRRSAKESVAKLGPKTVGGDRRHRQRERRDPRPRSARPIPTTPRATARSTCRARRARRARR